MYACYLRQHLISEQNYTKRKRGSRQADGLVPLTARQSVFFPYQLAEFIGQFLDHHPKTLKLLEHADKVLAGEATDHLQIFTRT